MAQQEPGRSPSGSSALVEQKGFDAGLGMHPAFEKDQKLAPRQEGVTEFDAVRSIQSMLKSSVCDLDAHLTNAQRTVMNALLKMLQQDFEPAALFAIWCEQAGYEEYKKPYGGSLPFPLNEIVAYSERRRIRRHLARRTAEEVYEKALNAVEAMASFLEDVSSKGSFCFGAEPCSLDAFLLGHLLFFRFSPCMSPQLQRKLYQTEILMKYMDTHFKNYFGEIIPPILPEAIPPEAQDEEDMKTAWFSPFKKGESWKTRWGFSEWTKLDRASKLWLGSAVVLLIGYTWMSPPFTILIGQNHEVLVDEDED